ncbi:MAG: formylglycine-generating enzyme family protein, partial [Gammaproteobacteria bacterium]
TQYMPGFRVAPTQPTEWVLLMRKLEHYPEVFPEAWASAWGRDETGLWMAFTYKGISQTFRWIEPGTFLMGSPKDEPERYQDEVLHEVTLSRGFWLADTAVTQVLWQAVMGKNPSRFKGDRWPVDTVGWHDAMAFFEKLNALNPALKLDLPTEAQWEYACRAGTTTPFSFGEQIDSSLVNFDGTVPYNDGAKSEYRQETVEVKSLPANAWGLYEMHGNVLEWCRDWYEDYAAATVTDPKGPATGARRVLRGGSWIFNGRDCRSAFRFDYAPSFAIVHIGFRLARGQ